MTQTFRPAPRTRLALPFKETPLKSVKRQRTAPVRRTSSRTSPKPINTARGQPYVDAVIYASKNYPGRYYIVKSYDLTTQLTPPYQHGTDTWAADGDFNDFVYTVEGVVCQGGGQL